MQLTITWQGKSYVADHDHPIDISIPLMNGLENQPNAFGAPLYEATPLRSGDFVGAIEFGSPVNFYNLRVNPHGNGTHTECVGHILNGDFSIRKSLRDVLVVAELVSVYPELRDNGDRVITERTLDSFATTEGDALIIRTLPNDAQKRTTKYTGANPPYFSEDAMHWIVSRRYRHLLIDLPSVDPEVDGGALIAHKIFWEVAKNPAEFKTITEMIFVDNNVSDGLYLLNLQVAPLKLDASPGRPVLFKLTEVK